MLEPHRYVVVLAFGSANQPDVAVQRNAGRELPIKLALAVTPTSTPAACRHGLTE